MPFGKLKTHFNVNSLFKLSILTNYGEWVAANKIELIYMYSEPAKTFQYHKNIIAILKPQDCICIRWFLSNSDENVVVPFSLIHSLMLLFIILLASPTFPDTYRQTFNIRRTSVGNKIVDHSDVVGAPPVGAAPSTSSLLTKHMDSMDLTKTTVRRDKNFFFIIWCVLY